MEVISSPTSKSDVKISVVSKMKGGINNKKLRPKSLPSI